MPVRPACRGSCAGDRRRCRAPGRGQAAPPLGAGVTERRSRPARSRGCRPGRCRPAGSPLPAARLRPAAGRQHYRASRRAAQRPSPVPRRDGRASSRGSAPRRRNPPTTPRPRHQSRDRRRDRRACGRAPRECRARRRCSSALSRRRRARRGRYRPAKAAALFGGERRLRLTGEPGGGDRLFQPLDFRRRQFDERRADNGGGQPAQEV